MDFKKAQEGNKTCETGIIELEPVALPSSHNPNPKCRCTMCGPIGDNGGRRCQITLSMVGAFISQKRDGRFRSRHDGGP